MELQIRLSEAVSHAMVHVGAKINIKIGKKEVAELKIFINRNAHRVTWRVWFFFFGVRQLKNLAQFEWDLWDTYLFKVVIIASNTMNFSLRVLID